MYPVEILCSKARTNSVVNFYDCLNFNRKNGRTYPYNTPKVVYSSHYIHSLFLCKCTFLGNSQYKSNWQHPLRSCPLIPCKALCDIFVHCSVLLYDWWSSHALDDSSLSVSSRKTILKILFCLYRWKIFSFIVIQTS